MRTKRDGTQRRRGFALMYTAIALTVLTVFCGLAVDATVLFLVRAKLSAAVDAAALSGARSVNLGTDVATANSAATSAAQSFFLANFPNGYLGSQAMDMTHNFTATFNQNATTGLLTVAVTANVQAPVYFMRILGFSNITVSAAGSATRRALAVMLVLDISGSMANSYNGGTACAAMQTAADNFISNFSPYDYLGMISFEGTAHLTYPPDTNWKTGNALKNMIDALSCSGSTNTTAALNLAYSQLKTAINLPLAVNTIVLFTDGMPNAISSNAWPVRNFVDTRYGGSSSISVDPTTCPNDGSHYGHGYCGDSSGKCSAEGSLCAMAKCTSTAGTISGGVISQSPNYHLTGTSNGLDTDFDGESIPSNVSGCPALNSNDGLRQTIAYIPDTDRFGNSVKYASGSQFRDLWVFPVNNQCNPSGTCAYLGGLWSSYPGGTNSNFYPASDPALSHAVTSSGHWRFDQPTSIGAAGMNAAASQAATIRSDTTYNIAIHSIYLLGNGTDPVDKYFLPRVSNVAQVPPLPLYEATGTAAVANPGYVSTQTTGLFFAASDKSQLNQLFAKIASSLLRLNQ
ncbi:MAG: VWA domain-containing protein [Bryobacteraceae bacterium]